ncbi:g10892 [Coccomyxa viridis]|uniref:G10892 protein n=1 Tax=Coccomyxa viridis TaxID=1274662 RepID=A0ABP1GCE7_9CHLO
MQNLTLRCCNKVRLPLREGQCRRSQITGARCLRCALPTHVVSATIASTSIYCASVIGLMIAAPRARVTHRIVSIDALFVPMALAYAFLLAHSWQADTLKLILPGSLQEGFSGGFNPQFFPKLEGIMSLFSRGVTAASLWVHLLAINLFSARTILREGLEVGHSEKDRYCEGKI